MHIYTVSDFNMQRYLGVLYINLQVRHPFQQVCAHFHAQLHRRHFKFLVGTAGLYLKRQFFLTVVFQHMPIRLFADVVKLHVIQPDTGADGMQAKNRFQLGNSQVIVQFTATVLHDQTPGITHNVVVADGIQVLANRRDQTVDEDILVVAAHGDLAVFHDQYLFSHKIVSSLLEGFTLKHPPRGSPPWNPIRKSIRFCNAAGK